MSETQRRALIVFAVAWWYVAVRFIIYWHIIEAEPSASMRDFAWGWSWFMAAPVAAGTIFIPFVIIAFIFQWRGFP